MTAGAAAGAVVDFESIPTGTEINGTTVNGLTFSDVLLPGQPYERARVVSDPPSFQYIQGHYLIGSTVEGNALSMALDTPASDFSFGFGGSIVSFQDVTAIALAYGPGNTLLDTKFVTGTELTADPSQPGSPFLREGFVSFSGIGNITRVDVSFAADSRFWKLDAISFTPVPAPGSLAVGSVTLLGMTPRRRRR